MPLFKEWKAGEHGLAAIWKVEEPESFFKERTGVDTTIKNEQKRIEHLAGRYLLKHLEEDFPLWNIDKDEHDKPRVDGNKYFFSISHSWPYVAAMIDTRNEAGIDIQIWRSNIDRIQHKFLSSAEQQLFNNDMKLITIAWCAKEAAYKWNGRRGVDFIKHLPISFFNKEANIYKITININLIEEIHSIHLKNMVFDDFACSFVHNIE